MNPAAQASVQDLARASTSVGELIKAIRQEQWTAPTPCSNWTVRELLVHVVGMNLVFTAIINEQEPPVRGADPLGEDPAGAYAHSAASLLAAFERQGALERVYRGPLGSATGADRLQIRLYDLLAHGWDLAQATGQHPELPEDLAEKSLAFARTQLEGQPRTGRFDPIQPVAADAPAIDRLAAFLGRRIGDETTS